MKQSSQRKLKEGALDVIYQCDDTYASYCAVSLTSLLENNRDLDLYVHIMSDAISPRNQTRLREVVERHKQSIEFVNGDYIKRELSSIGVAPFRGESYATFFKIFAYNDLQSKTGRLLYIDCDILILKSIKELCDFDLGRYTLGMVEDFIGTWYKTIVKIPEEEAYYNAGVMLVDQKRWREKKLTGKILNQYKKTGKNYWLADQDILNICCRKDVKRLDIKYDLFSQFYDGVRFTRFIYGTRKAFYTNSRIRRALKDPTMVHCMNGWYGRPWEEPNEHPMKENWAKYLNMTPFKDERKVANPNRNYGLDKNLSKLPALHKVLIAIRPRPFRSGARVA